MVEGAGSRRGGIEGTAGTCAMPCCSGTAMKVIPIAILLLGSAVFLLVCLGAGIEYDLPVAGVFTAFVAGEVLILFLATVTNRA
jgi:hypothetical protein